VARFVCGPGIFGLVIAAVIAALMSTLDTLLSAVSAVAVNDIWRLARPGRADAYYLRAARLAAIGATVLGLALIPLFQRFGTIYQALSAFTAMITPPLLTVILLGILWKRFTTRAAFWTLLIFGAVIFVLGKFAWKPVLSGLQKREQFIHDSLEQARADREQAEKSMKEHAAQLEKARSEASSIVEEGRRDAEVFKRAIQDEAKKESDAMISRARKEIDLARDSAVSELYNLTADLAADAAGRIIRRQLSPADHAELVRESIEEIRSLREGNGRGVQN